MKVTVIAAVVLMAVALIAQSSLTMVPGGLLSACPAPVAGSKALVYCNVAGDPANPDGLYVSANGAAYFQVSQSVGGGVTSWNGRTGKVVSAPGDYSYSQLSAPPTTIDCATWSVAQNGHLIGSNCTIK